MEQVFSQFGVFGFAVIVRVLDDALANLERQIQAREIGIPQLQIFHGAQRLQVVIEELAVAAHQEVQRALAGVSKRRMADVVDQSQRLDQIDIQVERRGNGARDLRHFHGVRQASTEMVGVAARAWITRSRSR